MNRRLVLIVLVVFLPATIFAKLPDPQFTTADLDTFGLDWFTVTSLRSYGVNMLAGQEGTLWLTGEENNEETNNEWTATLLETDGSIRLDLTFQHDSLYASIIGNWVDNEGGLNLVLQYSESGWEWVTHHYQTHVRIDPVSGDTTRQVLNVNTGEVEQDWWYTANASDGSIFVYSNDSEWLQPHYFFRKYDSSGSLLWEAVPNDTAYYASAISILPTEDGGAVIAIAPGWTGAEGGVELQRYNAQGERTGQLFYSDDAARVSLASIQFFDGENVALLMQWTTDEGALSLTLELVNDDFEQGPSIFYDSHGVSQMDNISVSVVEMESGTELVVRAEVWVPSGPNSYNLFTRWSAVSPDGSVIWEGQQEGASMNHIQTPLPILAPDIITHARVSGGFGPFPARVYLDGVHASGEEAEGHQIDLPDFPEMSMVGYSDRATCGTDGSLYLLAMTTDQDNWMDVATIVRISPQAPTGLENSGMSQPKMYSLASPWPNPFNSSTRVTYSLPISESIKLAVFDVLGREVTRLASGPQSAGHHQVQWHADSAPSGIYFIRLECAEYNQTRKVVLVK